MDYRFRLREKGDRTYVETLLGCINGLNAWFTLGVIYGLDEASVEMTAGNIVKARDCLRTAVDWGFTPPTTTDGEAEG